MSSIPVLIHTFVCSCVFCFYCTVGGYLLHFFNYFICTRVIWQPCKYHSGNKDQFFAIKGRQRKLRLGRQMLCLAYIIYIFRLLQKRSTQLGRQHLKHSSSIWCAKTRRPSRLAILQVLPHNLILRHGATEHCRCGALFS